MSTVQVVNDTSAERIDAAARVWAAAIGARDRTPELVSVEQARARLDEVFAQARTEVAEAPASALLLTALEPDGTPVGFAAAQRSGLERAELRFFAVAPAVWGRGIGGLILTELARCLRARGVAGAELWVYRTNYPALELYEKLGWRYDGPTRTHPRTGETMLHYSLDLV